MNGHMPIAIHYFGPPSGAEQPAQKAVACVPRNSKSGHQLIQNTQAGNLSLSR